MLNKEKWTWIVKSKNGEKHIVELNNCEGKHKVLVDEILVGNMNPSKYVCHNYECAFMIDDSISCSIVALSICIIILFLTFLIRSSNPMESRASVCRHIFLIPNHPHIALRA